MSFKYSFENTNAVPDLNSFFWVAASIADAVLVNHNGIKTLLISSMSTFFINGNPTDYLIVQESFGNPTFRQVTF